MADGELASYEAVRAGALTQAREIRDGAGTRVIGADIYWEGEAAL